MSEIITRLNKVMDDVGAVGKDGRNTHQNFDFRGIDAVVNATSPAFRKHGIVVVPTLNSIDYETVEVGQNRSRMASVRVNVTYTFHAPDGSNVSATVAAESMDSGDKATAKAMSVAFRIALLQTLCLPTTDIDPDAQSYERSPAPAKPVQKSTPKTDDKPKRAELGSMARKKTDDDAPKTVRPVSSEQLRLMGELIDQIDGDADLLKDLCGKDPQTLTIDEAKSVINDLLMVKRGSGSLVWDDNGRAYVEKEGA
jgi:hypothetical protein